MKLKKLLIDLFDNEHFESERQFKVDNTLYGENELKRYESGDVMISSSNPQNFATSLWEYARRNNTSSSLVNSFDAFADAGAMYKGQSIKDIPELQELYKIIRNSPRMFSMTEVSEMLEDIEAGR